MTESASNMMKLHKYRVSYRLRSIISTYSSKRWIKNMIKYWMLISN